MEVIGVEVDAEGSLEAEVGMHVIAAFHGEW